MFRRGETVYGHLFRGANFMDVFAMTIVPIAAAGYSLVYLLGGGGLLGALVIFIVAKMFGK
jgi:hypothetical protein